MANVFIILVLILLLLEYQKGKINAVTSTLSGVVTRYAFHYNILRLSSRIFDTISLVKWMLNASFCTLGKTILNSFHSEYKHFFESLLCGWQQCVKYIILLTHWFIHLNMLIKKIKDYNQDYSL